MKTLRSLTLVAILLLGAVLATGCASAHVKSATAHRIVAHGIILPPGWSAIIPNVNNAPANNQLNQITYTASGTNAVGFFSPRPHVFVAFDESWTDTSAGGGTFLLTDPKASALAFAHTNQNALGGGRTSSVGEVDSTITTNAVALVNAVGSAVGNVAAQVAKSAAKP
jgi:hypothetical protein